MARQPKAEIDDFAGASTEPPAPESAPAKRINLTLLSGGRQIMVPFNVTAYEYQDGVLSFVGPGGKRTITNVEFMAVEE